MLVPRFKRRMRREEPPDWPARFSDLAYETHNDRLRSFYEAGSVSGQSPISEAPMVALDFETTGLNPEIHGIVSIGLVPFDIRRIYCRDARHWLVDPRRPMEKESVVIHGITDSDIEGAPDLVEVLDDLLNALAGRIVVVHYRAIERRFLDAALRLRLTEGIFFPVIDTMDLEARIYRQPPSLWDRLRGRRRPSIRLADSRTRYGLPHYQPHNALTDALATAELLQAQIAYRYSPDTPVEALWR